MKLYYLLTMKSYIILILGSHFLENSSGPRTRHLVPQLKEECRESPSEMSTLTQKWAFVFNYIIDPFEFVNLCTLGTTDGNFFDTPKTILDLLHRRQACLRWLVHCLENGWKQQDALLTKAAVNPPICQSMFVCIIV